MKLLYYTHDAYVYPSYGEGFGLTPFQALATGMPTITLPGWAPYRRFIDPKLEISHKLVRSNWPKIHPGQVMRPNFDEVIDRMRYVADNYDDARDFACSNAFDLHAAYDWDIITAQVFSDLKKRLK
jgi:glycosyltransferase involved in cell wall biosynthesis